MLSVEEQLEIKVLVRQGLSIREIFRQLQVSRNTVRRYLREVDAAKRKPRSRRPRKLDPYCQYRSYRSGYLLRSIGREITLLGYRGGMSRLRLFLRGLRIVRQE